MSTFKQIYDFYEALLAKLLHLAGKFKFDAKHPLHLHAVALYGSILELSSSLRPLYLSEHYSSVPIILRSLLEAYVDLENLSKDPKYGYSLELSYLEEILKFLKEAKSDQNIYMTIIAQKPDLDNRVDDFKTKIATLKGKGYKNLDKFKKFQKANLENEYRTIYNMLCCAAHNNYRSLRDRHMSFNNGRIKVEYFKKPDFEELENCFGVTCEILVRASFSIHGLLKTAKIPELRALRENLNKLRGEA
jgi:hypothetical protein